MIPLGVLASARVAAAGGTLSIDYLSTLVQGTSAATQTWTGVSLGTAAADRTILLAITCQTVAGGVLVSSLTVGGVAATVDVTERGQYSDVSLYFARVAVPAGTTGDVALTLSGVWRSVSVSLWRATGAAVAFDSYVRHQADPASVSVATVAGGCAVAAAVGRTTVVGAWTGVTGGYNLANQFTHAYGSAATPSAGNLTVTRTTVGQFGALVAVIYKPA